MSDDCVTIPPGTAGALETAARTLFDVNGYDATHVKAIAQAAGVSVSTFYARFGSKEQAYRSVNGNEPPTGDRARRQLTGRALRTREALIATARECIERDGYQAARIGDIAERAKVAVGSFYTYFPSKLDVFTEVMRRCVTELRGLQPAAADGKAGSVTDRRDQIRERLGTAVEHYVTTYTRYATLVLRMNEAVAIHPELMPLWLDLHREFAGRITHSLRRWQQSGLIDPELDPDHAGHALAAMVGQSSQIWITFGQPHDQATAIATLTRLWTNGIRLAPT